MPYTINFDLILPKLRASTRKQALSDIAMRTAPRIHCNPVTLQKELINHELEASSASGDGVAIPNIQLEGLDRRFVALATLRTPADFEAVDGQNVDIICALFSPQADGPIHLRGLSRITRMFKNELLRQKLRDTNDVDIIRSLLVNPEGWLLAA